MLYKQYFFIILLIKDKAQRQQTRRRPLTGRLLRGRYCIINFAKNQVKKLFLPPCIDLLFIKTTSFAGGLSYAMRKQ